MKTSLIAVALAGLTLFAPATTFGHDGHAHKAMGTITSIQGNHLMVKTTDGKTVMVMLDAKTKITRGKAKVEAGTLKVGDRVVAEGPEEKAMLMAATLRVGETPAAAAKK